MDIFTILQLGYIVIVGFVFLIMFFQLLAYYIAGRLTGSINDEFVNAFTLFGALLFIGIVSALVNAVLTTFLTGTLIPGIIAFVVYLIVIIYAVVKIYELSIGKAILHLIISLVVTVALTGLTVYVGTLVIPEVDLGDVMEMNPAGASERALEAQKLSEENRAREIAEMEAEEQEYLDSISEDEETEEVTEEEPVPEAEAEAEETAEETTPSGPGLPGSTE